MPALPDHFAAALPNFLGYFAVAALLLAVFMLIYLIVTPYKEIELIRGGNTAAAITLSGALFGFAMPIANVIAHSDTLLDLVFWGLVAGAIQLAAYVAVRLLLPHLAEDIPAGRTAPATLAATFSVTIGLINAACMTY